MRDRGKCLYTYVHASVRWLAGVFTPEESSLSYRTPELHAVRPLGTVDQVAPGRGRRDTGSLPPVPPHPGAPRTDRLSLINNSSAM